METFESEELTDAEFSEMLATWKVTVPSHDLQARIFSSTRFTFGVIHDGDRLESPWSLSLIGNVRDLLNPAKLPSLEITSNPVEVGTIWGAYAGGQSRWGVFSVGAHVAVVLLALFVFQNPTAQRKLKDVTVIYFPVNTYKPKLPNAKAKASGGGGGGQRALTPVAKGAAPQFAPKQFMPPAVAVAKPRLPMTATITASAPVITAYIYGDPLNKLTGDPAGQGINGFSNGKGSGLGNGDGDGSGGGTDGGIYRAGGGVSSPILIFKVEPEYSEEARRAKYSGTVLLSVVVDEHGVPTEIRVVRPMGLGLDEKAIEAVQKWRFRAGVKNGRPVRVRATVEVSFRLL